MNYKVSVIIPVYNGEKYIEECIESLINQSIGFNNIEVIIVDDNSKDNSRKVIENLAKKHSNITPIFLKKNTGTASGPRNEGIKYSTSDYIMFLDMDDYYYSEMCEKMYDTITKNNVDVVTCRYTMGTRTDYNKVKNHFFDGVGDIKVDNVSDYPKIMSCGFSTMIWTKIFKKSVILKNNIEFPVGDLYEDVYFTSNFYLHAKGIVLLTDYYGYGYNVRRDGDMSFSQKFSKNMFNRQLSGFKKIMKMLKKYDYKTLKSELVIDMTKIYLFTDLSNNEQKSFLNYMRPYYKKYNLFTRLGSTNIFFNIIINIFVKLFRLSNFIPICVSNLKSRF